MTAVDLRGGRLEDLAKAPGPAALEHLAPAPALVALLDRAASLEDLAPAPFPVTLWGLRTAATLAASLEDLTSTLAMPARLVLTAPVVPAASVAPN